MRDDGVMRRVHVVVTGMVQGVGYRWTLQNRARRADVAGWARNRDDGAVEAELEGEPELVDRVLTWMAEGPPGSQVRHVETTELDPTGASTFDIRS